MTLVLCAAAAWTTVTNLGVNTDSTGMLSQELDFQVRQAAIHDKFPAIRNNVVITIETGSPDATLDFAAKLAATLNDNDDTISRVFAPEISPFFQQNGMLYQDLPDLERDLETINNAAPFLAALRENRSIDHLGRVLTEVMTLADQADFDRAFLNQFMERLSATMETRIAGSPEGFSWLDAMAASPDPDDRQVVMLVVPKLDFSLISPAKPARLAIQAAIDEVTADVPYAVEVGLTGDPILRGEELRSVADGIGLSVIISLIATFLLLIVCYRSLTTAILTFAALLVTLILTTGFAAGVVGDLNLVSIAFFVLMIGLGLDFSIHVLLHLAERRPTSKDKLQFAAKLLSLHTGRTIGSALILAALTTSLAFLSFATTDFTGMAQLGIIGGVGVIIAFLVSITVLPAFIVLLPGLFLKIGNNKPKQALVAYDGAEPSTPSTVKLLHYGLAAVIVVATLGATTLINEAYFDADPMNLRDPEASSVVALNPLFDKPENAPYRLSALTASEEEALALVDKLNQLPQVHEAVALPEFVPGDQEDKLLTLDISFPSFIEIIAGDGVSLPPLEPGSTGIDLVVNKLAEYPNNPSATRLLAVFNDMIDANSADLRFAIEDDIFRHFGGVIFRFQALQGIGPVEQGDIPEELTERYLSQDGTWRVDVLPAENMRNFDLLNDYVRAVQEVAPEAAGAPLQIVSASDVVGQAMVQAVLIALVAVAILSFLATGHLSVVIAILIPLGTAAVLVVAASVLFDVPFNYANIIVLPLLIGLGVDSGIHLAMRRKALEETGALFESSTPRAVLFSSLTTVAAFASLGLSDHQGTASMGILLTFAIGLTLLCTITLTPILLDFGPKKAMKTPT